MDMRQLRYFVQIVECGSLTKASRQLLIAQPALSQQMARLEDEIGKPLLVRSVRGVVPTPNGDALYHHAKFMLRQLDDAVVIARQDHASVRGRVTLGLPPTTVHTVGLPILRHIRRRYPNITLNIVEALSTPLEDMARLGQVDLALLIRQSATSDLHFEPVLEEGLYVILPSDSTLVAPEKTSLTLAEVASLPLLLPSSNPSHSLRRKIFQAFEHAQLKPNIITEVDSLILLLKLIAEGDGVTIRTMAASRVLYTADHWRCLSISDANMTLTHYLFAPPQERLLACTSIVRTELRDVVRQLVHTGEWPGTWLV